MISVSVGNWRWPLVALSAPVGFILGLLLTGHGFGARGVPLVSGAILGSIVASVATAYIIRPSTPAAKPEPKWNVLSVLLLCAGCLLALGGGGSGAPFGGLGFVIFGLGPACLLGLVAAVAAARRRESWWLLTALGFLNVVPAGVIAVLVLTWGS